MERHAVEIAVGKLEELVGLVALEGDDSSRLLDDEEPVVPGMAGGVDGMLEDGLAEDAPGAVGRRRIRIADDARGETGRRRRQQHGAAEQEDGKETKHGGMDLRAGGGIVADAGRGSKGHSDLPRRLHRASGLPALIRSVGA